MALATSRLWDAINGFFFLFAHMFGKLSRNASQLELLREFLGLLKDMIVLMLSMLEGASIYVHFQYNLFGSESSITQ